MLNTIYFIFGICGVLIAICSILYLLPTIVLSYLFLIVLIVGTTALMILTYKEIRKWSIIWRTYLNGCSVHTLYGRYV